MTSLIGICGATGTGKSTICKRLERENEDYRHIALDNFFKGKDSYRRMLGYADMEQPDCTDFDSAFLALYSLKLGNNVTIPKFSKSKDAVVGEKVIEHGNIILVEGYHAFYDARIKTILDLKLYLEADEETIKKRRQERDGICTDEYFHKIIMPVYRHYSALYEDAADIVIDANRSLEEVANDVKSAITQHIDTVKFLNANSGR